MNPGSLRLAVTAKDQVQKRDLGGPREMALVQQLLPASITAAPVPPPPTRWRARRLAPAACQVQPGEPQGAGRAPPPTNRRFHGVAGSAQMSSPVRVSCASLAAGGRTAGGGAFSRRCRSWSASRRRCAGAAPHPTHGGAAARRACKGAPAWTPAGPTCSPPGQRARLRAPASPARSRARRSRHWRGRARAAPRSPLSVRGLSGRPGVPERAFRTRPRHARGPSARRDQHAHGRRAVIEDPLQRRVERRRRSVLRRGHHHLRSRPLCHVPRVSRAPAAACRRRCSPRRPIRSLAPTVARPSDPSGHRPRAWRLATMKLVRYGVA